MSNYYVANIDDLHSGFMDGCILWWRAEGRGYTCDLNDAGVFTEEHREKGYPPEKCLWIPCETVDAICQVRRLAWYSNFPDEAVERVKALISAEKSRQRRLEREARKMLAAGER